MTKQRLLIVDDDVDVAEFVGDVAAESGFAPTTLSDPDRFFSVYRSTVPDGLVLDLMMPGKDGVEVLRFLGETKCEIPILLFSGFDPRVLDTAGRLGRESGLKIMGILRKPATVSELQAALKKAFPGMA